MKNNKTTIGILAAASILAITAVAFAHGGYGRYMGGYDGHMMGPGYGGGHMMMDDDYGYGRHMRGYGDSYGLSDEEAEKLDSARERFFDETRELRGKIDEKQIAMRNEMIKENPDQNKVITLQKELSGLQAEFDQKAINHRLEMRKLMPENYEHRGYARRDSRGPGYCW